MRKTGIFNITILASLLFLGVFGFAQALTMQEIIAGQTSGQVLGATTNGLVGYWNFDEGSGTVAHDTSGNGNDGTITGATWSANPPAGGGSGVLSFNGSNDYITTASEFLGSGPLTISAWINARTNGGAGFGRIIDNGKIIFGVNNGTGIKFMSDGATAANTASGILGYNKWIHVTATRDANGTANLYINGVLSGAGNQNSGTPVPGTTHVLIGNNSAVQRGFDGFIDDIRIYNRVLSVSEILDIYNDTGSTQPPLLDTESPTAPTNLLATAISSSQINLSWTASTDNVGVTGYKIYRNGSQIGTSAATSYSDSGLTASTTYSYTVSAFDAAGNNSIQSSSASATTQAGAVGGTIIAASCSRADVQEAINSVADGGMVTIPPGSCTWTTGLSINKGITLTGSGIPNAGAGTFGAGTPTTVIIDNVNGNGLVSVTGITTGQTFRISLLDIEPNSSTTPLGSPVGIAGTCNLNGCPNIRIDNIVFGETTEWTEHGNGAQATSMIRTDNVFGVIDHCTIPNGSDPDGAVLLNFNNSAWGGVGGWGDNSWAQPDSFGTATNLYLENNYVSITKGVTDTEFAPIGGSYGGGRFVGRFNQFTSHNGWSVFANHGLETDGRARGGRQWEAYGNSINCPVSSTGGCGNLVGARSGTGFVFGNTISDGPYHWFGAFLGMVMYRNVFTALDGWGACGGSGPYDTNDGAVYYSGTNSGTNGSTILTDNTKSWATNRLVQIGSPYSVYDVTKNWWAEIKSNTATTLTIQDSIPEQVNTFNNGDSYQILRATVCADQPTRGAGAYVSGSYLTPPSPVGPLNESLDPAYEWDDTANLVSNGNVGAGWTVRIMANRDWYTDNSNGTPRAQTSPTSPFNGTSGVGFGTLANRPVNCTPHVGYWATDQGNWNQSGNSFGQGKLFVCTSANTWSDYYNPFTYPYPLTVDGLPNPSLGSGGGTVNNGGDTTPPAAPTGVNVQ
jgi:chitodextrinase